MNVYRDGSNRAKAQMPQRPNVESEAAPSQALQPGSGSKPNKLQPLDLQTLAIIGLFVLAFFLTLRNAKSLFLPIIVAILFAFLLDPAVRALGRLRIPRGIASASLLLVFLALLGTGLQQTMEPAQRWLSESPANLDLVEKKIRDLLKPVEEVTEAALQVEKLASIQAGSEDTPVEASREPSLRQSLFDGTQDLLFGIVVVMILTHFLLSTGDRLLGRIVELLPRKRDKKQAIELARRVQKDLSSHLLTIAAINLFLGVTVGLVTHLFGLPNPVIWGTMATLLNFIPYFGAAVGVVILAGASLLTFDSPLYAMAVPFTYFVMTTFEGMLITPSLLGRRLSLNPIIIFLSLFFWGWLWGVAGALLAVPLLISLKIACDGSERLRPFGQLIGS